MSVTELKVVNGGNKTLHVVEAFRHQNASAWEVADALVEDVHDWANERDPALAQAMAEGADGKHTRLDEALVDVLSEARKEGVDIKTRYAGQCYRTAVAWPAPARAGAVSFKVHYRLRAKPNRKALLDKWVQKYGTVTEQDAIRLLSERKPKALVPFVEMVDKRVRDVLKQAGKPWGHVAQDDREEIAHRLRILADEVQDGSFGLAKQR